MKLLLTSAGLTNKSISDALLELVGKPASETTIAFIPTAMNVERGDKDWVIDDLNNIYKLEFKCVDIVDISALPKTIWQPRLDTADVLFFCGGNTSHLMRWIKESGLIELLPEMLKTKVWAGISAGSIVTNPLLTVSSKDDKIYYEEKFGYNDEQALGLVDFYTRPHYNSPSFPHSRKDIIGAIAEETGKTIYALDDNSAIKVVDGKIEVISEGDYFKFN
ncbi:MAG: Type 1 glutamine amidotransferase-like domain-containing protein [Candidatus Pacebacteria bacterium]|nr:Type 1 glutamine amidotransferase-like domain-containing protein [Candidatus Paceibacterota bacterium]